MIRIGLQITGAFTLFIIMVFVIVHNLNRKEDSYDNNIILGKKYSEKQKRNQNTVHNIGSEELFNYPLGHSVDDICKKVMAIWFDGSRSSDIKMSLKYDNLLVYGVLNKSIIKGSNILVIGNNLATMAATDRYMIMADMKDQVLKASFIECDALGTMKLGDFEDENICRSFPLATLYPLYMHYDTQGSGAVDIFSCNPQNVSSGDYYVLVWLPATLKGKSFALNNPYLLDEAVKELFYVKIL